MKTYQMLLFAMLFSFSYQSCLKDKCEQEITYVKSTPIYKTVAEIRAGIDLQSPTELVNPGKIYFYNNYLFINEIREGIHILDNTDPANPVNLAFLEIPGNVDISVSDQILYADNYTDLLAINLTDMNNPVLVDRVENAFPNMGQQADGSILVYFEEELVTEIVDCNSGRGGWGWQEDLVLTANNSGGFSGDKATSGAGVGGSLARFTITQGHLYTIDNFDLKVFDLSQKENPTQVATVSLGWGIETIYPYDGKLFIGSNTGMNIYDLSNPAAPVYLSGYSHWTACDPVFVKDNYAYVTLRSGTLCNGSTLNQMDLIDISDITNPFLVTSFGMENPHGLSIKENNLFLCEGENGLKIFDIEKPLELDQHLLAYKKDRAATDVIVVPGDQNTLMVIGQDGFYQYNFDNPQELKELSFLPVIGGR